MHDGGLAALPVPVWCVVREINARCYAGDPELRDPCPWLFSSREATVRWCCGDLAECVDPPDGMKEFADEMLTNFSGNRLVYDRGDVEIKYVLREISRLSDDDMPATAEATRTEDCAPVRSVNKYGVQHHQYLIELEDGEEICVDVGCEEDWGDIQQIFDDSGVECVGWGNDADGHIRVVGVVDTWTGERLPPLDWAKSKVWSLVDDYSC